MKWNEVKCTVSNYKWNEMKWNVTDISSRRREMKFMKCIFYMKFHEISWGKKGSPNEVKALTILEKKRAERNSGGFPRLSAYHGGYFREYQSCARWLRTPPNSKRDSQISSTDLQDGHPLEVKGLQNSTDITKWGRLQGIHQMAIILTEAKLYPSKTLQRELLTYVTNQLPFFLFPPNRCRHKKQNHLIKWEKKFQEGKWEDLWKQSISEFETEQSNIKPQKELSTAHKVRKSEHFHQHEEISREDKVFTNNENQRMTQDMLSTSVSYSLTQVQTMTVHRTWEMTCRNTDLLKLI